jgi:nucleotide-binding universal stress UspA family protein
LETGKMIPKISTILFPTDLGPQAHLALVQAEALAVATGARIVLLHVLEPTPPHARSVIEEVMNPKQLEQMRRSGVEMFRADLEGRIRAFLDKESAASTEASIKLPEVRIAEGGSAPVILEQAEKLGADLIVMGTQGNSLWGDMLGSVAHKVLHRSKIPVLLVPFRDSED